MDLLSSIRKSGSRGGVNFSWEDVQTSQHRENYLGHSLHAPVGRWQKGRDLNWYAKGDDKTIVDGETTEETRIRERKEEIRKIKEAEEDALARAMGLPVPDRGVTGANAITIGEVNRVVKESAIGEDEGEEGVKGFGDFVGRVDEKGKGRAENTDMDTESRGGLLGEPKADRRKRDDRRERRTERTDGGRGGDKAHRREDKWEDRGRSKSPSRDPPSHRERNRDHERRRRRRSGSKDHRRYRSRSRDSHRRRERSREDRRHRSRSREGRRHRERSRDTYRKRPLSQEDRRERPGRSGP